MSFTGKKINSGLATAMLLGAFAVTGCCSMERVKDNYNANMAAGNYPALVPLVADLAEEEDSDRLMWQLMAGSAYRLSGDSPNALAQFDRAEDTMIAQDQTSVFSKSATSSWAMMTNDKAFDYDGGGQDRIFTCLYKAIDYATAGNDNAARTELNRAAQHQENWLHERRKDIASAQDRMEKDVAAYRSEKNETAQSSSNDTATVNAAFMNDEFASSINAKCGFDPRTSGILDNLQPVDWMNPYATHVTGIFRWLNGDDARNFLKDTATICPQNTVAVRDFAECDKGVTPKNQVWIWIEDGLCPERKEWRLDLPTFLLPFAGRYVFYVGMALPTFEPRAEAANNWTVNSAKGSVPMSQIADVDKLLKLEYDVYMRGALAREITRVVVKAGTQVAAGVVADSASDWRTQAALKASQLAFAAWAYSVTAADTRSWTALPKRVYAARIDRPSDGRIVVNASCGAVADITVPEGNSMIFISKPAFQARAVVKQVTYK